MIYCHIGHDWSFIQFRQMSYYLFIDCVIRFSTIPRRTLIAGDGAGVAVGDLRDSGGGRIQHFGEPNRLGISYHKDTFTRSLFFIILIIGLFITGLVFYHTNFA